MDVYKVVGSNIKKRRIQLQLSQEQLSELCGISRSYIGVIERGTKRCSLQTIVKIANQLHVGVDYLIKDLLLSSNDQFGEDMANYFKDVPEEKRESLKIIVKTVVKEYTK